MWIPSSCKVAARQVIHHSIHIPTPAPQKHNAKQLLEFDPKTGHYYFFNTFSGESRWAEEADFGGGEKEEGQGQGEGPGHVLLFGGRGRGKVDERGAEEATEEEEQPQGHGMVLVFTGACGHICDHHHHRRVGCS